MNSPQLTINARSEITPGMHHQDVVANQNIALIPGIVQRNAAIIKNRVNSFADSGTLGSLEPVNRNIRSVESRLGLGPRLVVSEA